MRKILVISILVIIILFIPSYAIAEDELTENDIINSQKESINIGKFLEEAKKYSSEAFSDIDYSEFLTSAITGNIDNETLGKGILNIIGKETIGSIRVIRKYNNYYSDT